MTQTVDVVGDYMRQLAATCNQYSSTMLLVPETCVGLSLFYGGDERGE